MTDLNYLNNESKIPTVIIDGKEYGFDVFPYYGEDGNIKNKYRLKGFKFKGNIKGIYKNLMGFHLLILAKKADYQDVVKFLYKNKDRLGSPTLLQEFQDGKQVLEFEKLEGLETTIYGIVDILVDAVKYKKGYQEPIEIKAIKELQEEITGDFSEGAYDRLYIKNPILENIKTQFSNLINFKSYLKNGVINSEKEIIIDGVSIKIPEGFFIETYDAIIIPKVLAGKVSNSSFSKEAVLNLFTLQEEIISKITNKRIIYAVASYREGDEAEYFQIDSVSRYNSKELLNKAIFKLKYCEFKQEFRRGDFDFIKGGYKKVNTVILPEINF